MMVPSDLLKNKKTNFLERKTLPDRRRNGRAWFAVRRELSCPQNEPELTVFGRINGHVTETVHYFFYCGLTGPPIQKNPTPTPMTPDAAAGLGGVVR